MSLGAALGPNLGRPMSERTLLLLRHAKAVPAESADGDAERALAPRGKRQARTLAGWFRGPGVVPDHVLSSPSARTRETLDIVRSGFGAAPPVEFDPVLYLAPWPAILERIRRVPEDAKSVLVVGHNPGLHELAVSLAVMSPIKRRHVLMGKFPTGALARFAVERPWRDFNRASITLVETLTPADLDPASADEE
jgi:phosphohistidine phosphatase